MNLLYLSIILVLLLIIVLAIIYRFPVKIKTGGSEPIFSDLTYEIVKYINPYLVETEKVKGTQNICDYLENYYDKTKNKKKDDHYLKKIINEIVDENNMKTIYEFLEKSNITYGCFLPDVKRNFLIYSYKYYHPTSRDISIIEKKLKEILKKEVMRSDIDNFLKYHKKYKFKDEVVNWNLNKIKKELIKNPEKIFEIDYVGILPELEKMSDKILDREKDREKIERINNYLFRLNILDSAASNYTIEELENRLKKVINQEVGKEYSRREFEREEKRKEENKREENKREEERRKEENKREEERRKRENEEAYKKEVELEEAFYKRLQEDPELEETAKALGMSLHDLFDQYKLEQEIIGSSEMSQDDNIILKIDESIIEKIRQDLKKKLILTI